MRTRKNFYRALSFITLLSVFFFAPDAWRAARAHNSKEWQERIAARTATLWIEGQPLGDGIVLNSRAELNVTWIERGLLRVFNTDNDVDEWVLDGLNYYSSSRRETRAKVKGRDLLVLRYRAIKRWNFDPTKLVVNGRAVAPDDILTRKGYWEGELAPGSAGMVTVATQPLKPGQTVELRYEDAAVGMEIPRRSR